MSGHLASAALVVALLLCLTFPFVFPALSIDDSPSYLNPAREWAAGRGLREANAAPLQYRLPLYPLLLGSTLRIAGESPVAIGLLNALLHALSILLVRSVLPRQPRSDLLCAAALVYPPLLTTTGFVLQESLIAFTLAALFAATTRALRPEASRGWGLAAGLAGRERPCQDDRSTRRRASSPSALAVCRYKAADVRVHRGSGVAAGPLDRPQLADARTLRDGQWKRRNKLVCWHGCQCPLAVLGHLPRIHRGTRALGKGGSRGGTGVRPLSGPFCDAAYRGRAVALGGPRPGAGLPLHAACPQWFVVTGRSQTASAGPVYLAAIAIQMLLFGACALLLIDGVRRSRDPSALVAPLIVFSHQFVYAASHASPRYGATVGPILFASLALVTLPSSGRAIHAVSP